MKTLVHFARADRACQSNNKMKRLSDPHGKTLNRKSNLYIQRYDQRTFNVYLSCSNEYYSLLVSFEKYSMINEKLRRISYSNK